jgi:hypothetical protein
MNAAARFASWELTVLVGGFIVIVLWKLLTGGISLNNLLYGDLRQRGETAGFTKVFSPGRAQLLMLTIISAVYYLLQVIHDPSKFPDLPQALVAILGGSQAVYLGGKAQSMLLGRLRDLIDRRPQ